MDDMLQVVAYLSSPPRTCLPFFEDFQIRVSDSRLDSSTNILNENRISIYQNLSLGADNQKEIKL